MRAVAAQRTADLCQRLRKGHGLWAICERLSGGAQEQQAGAGGCAAVAAPSLQLSQLLGRDLVWKIPVQKAMLATGYPSGDFGTGPLRRAQL